MSRFTRTITPFVLVAALAGSAFVAPVDAQASTPRAAIAKLLTCAGATVSRPTTFVISCADANAALSATHWSTWTATSATGTTRFALNLCKPYCAASKMTYFPHSTVTLTMPVATTHGRLFSKLVVRYLYKGRVTTFGLSWSGDPSF